VKKASFIHHERLQGQIFAPAKSVFPTSLWVMQEVEQCRSNCRGTKDKKVYFFVSFVPSWW